MTYLELLYFSVYRKGVFIDVSIRWSTLSQSKKVILDWNILSLA